MRRALVIKFGAIGDVAMAIPAAFALHGAGYEVDWVCGAQVAQVLGLYPWIRVIVGDERGLLQGGSVGRVRALGAIWRRIAGRRYDVCATLYYDPRYRVLALPVWAMRKVMLSTTVRAERLLTGRHHTDEYARILLGVEDGVRPVSLAPVRPERMPASPVGRLEGRRRVILAPAGARNMMRDDALRRWPLEHYVLAAKELTAYGIEVLLMGGPEDGWASSAFAGLGVVDCIGRFSLLETLGLLDDADVLLTHDTGPLHLAGMTSVGIVSIFGPTDPYGRLPRRDERRGALGRGGLCVQALLRWAGVRAVPRQCVYAAGDGRDGDAGGAANDGGAGWPRGGAQRRRAGEYGAGLSGQRALFLDRDGVINEEVGYLHRAEEVRFVDGIFSLCRTAMRLDYRIIVVTNQSGIARGYYSVAQFDGLMDWMRMKFREEQVELDAVYFCPYHPEHGVGEYRRDHPDRKPGFGMLLRGAEEFGIDLAASVMVGDRCSDVAAANGAGLRQAFLLAGTEAGACEGVYRAVGGLGEVEAWLVGG